MNIISFFFSIKETFHGDKIDSVETDFKFNT